MNGGETVRPEIGGGRSTGEVLYAGPFLEGEVSVFQPLIYSRHDLITAQNEPDAPLFVTRGAPADGRFAAQTRILRSGDSFVYRLYLRGDALIEALGRPGADEEFTVRQNAASRRNRGGYQSFDLGAVRLSEMVVVETPMGPALDSGWLWSPGAYKLALSSRENSPPDITQWRDANWREMSQAMARGAPLRASGGTGPLNIYLATSSRRLVANRTRGNAALASLSDPDAAFVAADPQAAARDEIIAWLKRNFDPVAPYASLTRACGPLPRGWSPTDSYIPLDVMDPSLAGARNRAAALDTYAACVERFKADYDLAPYAAIYPQVEDKLREWTALGGRIVTSEHVPSGGYIRGYASPAPEDVAAAFDLRVAMASDPRAQARAELAETERAVAQARYEAARKRQEADARARRDRIALQAAILDNVARANAGALPAQPSASARSGGAPSGSLAEGPSLTLTRIFTDEQLAERRRERLAHEEARRRGEAYMEEYREWISTPAPSAPPMVQGGGSSTGAAASQR